MVIRFNNISNGVWKAVKQEYPIGTSQELYLGYNGTLLRNNEKALESLQD